MTDGLMSYYNIEVSSGPHSSMYNTQLRLFLYGIIVYMSLFGKYLSLVILIFNTLIQMSEMRHFTACSQFPDIIYFDFQVL